MLAKINNLPRIKLAGLLAGVVLVVGGVAFVFINQQSRNSEIDQTLERLSLVSDGVEATNETQRAAGLAAKGRYSAAARLAEKANADLANLSQGVGKEGADVEVQGSVASAAKASGQVEASARALLAASKAERGDDLSKLRQARRDLKQSSRQIRKLTRQLNRAKRQLSRAIAALTAQLEELDSLDEPAREDAERAAGQLEQSTPPGLEEGITEQSEAQFVLLTERLDWIEPRPGPRSCGKSPTGAEVLINDGRVSCREASFVFNNSRGPNEATAPSGWDCSSFASALDGRQIRGAFGYSCVRTDSARISIDKEEVAAERQLEGFQTPSKNIGCALNESRVICSIAEATFDLPPKPASCNFDWGGGFILERAGPGKARCANDTVRRDSDPVLPYGTQTGFGPFVCAVEQSGVTCLNRQTKSGFSLSRESLDLW